MNEYERVYDLNEVAELKRKGKCYFKDECSIEKCDNNFIYPKTKYYKEKAEQFKRGQIVMVRDQKDHKWSAQTFQFKDDESDLNYRAGDLWWRYCRKPTPEEWEVFENGVSE